MDKITPAGLPADRVRICVGDLTQIEVDVIVNAANSGLMGGGGVDGAIHRAGRPALLSDCRRRRETVLPDGLPTGQVVETTGGRLPARYVLHTVGPVWGRHGGDEAALLAACYRNALARAAALECASIAFPAISTGIYGYPHVDAAQVVAGVLADWCASMAQPERIVLVFFSPRDGEIFSRVSGLPWQ